VRERSVEMIREHLRKVGLKVDPVPMEGNAMFKSLFAHAYDAIYFALEFDSLDPGRNLDFWLSSGSFHVWRMKQPKPGTTWEAEIDSLMTRQSTTIDMAERRKLLAEAERVLAAHEPAVYFAAPKMYVATSSRLGGVTASGLAPNVLWNAEALYIKPTKTDARR